MSMNFPQGTIADEAYETWRKRWTPPKTAVKALPGFAIVEFGPVGNRGRIIQPNAISYNAMMINDGNCQRASREGYLPVGTEIVFFGTGAGSFEIEGRILHRVKRSEVELYIPKEDAA